MPRKVGKSNLGLKRQKYLWAYLMIAPNVLGLLLFYIWPVLQTFYFSFTNWSYFGSVSWTGLSNYMKLFHDSELGKSLLNTAEYVVLQVPISLALSLLVAVLLNQKIRGVSVYRALYFIPVVTMPAAVAMVWEWLYNSNYGLINYVLGVFGIKGPQWVTNPHLALISVIVVAIWQSIGYNMIYFLSGLQAIPSTYYEAAAIDGAGVLRKFFQVTLPLLTPTIFFVLVVSLINSFQAFDLIYMMIGPTSPVISNTQTVVYLFYKDAFIMNQKGYAAAIAFLLFFIIMLVTALQMKLQKKWVHYQ